MEEIAAVGEDTTRLDPTPKQLWLLNFKNPLIERFGKEFFASIPKSPGVYQMLNEKAVVIYVGKAKNLRERLRSYTRVNSENSSRKVLRLVHSIRSIQWEVLANETEALLRENQLLRDLDPFFNVVNTAPQTYLFVHLGMEEKGIRIHLAMQEDRSYEEVYGAFKGLGLTYRAHKAILRLLWTTFNECRHGFELPGSLTSYHKLEHYLLPLPEHMTPQQRLTLYRGLKRFFNGTSKSLLHDLVEKLLNREDLAAFTREFVQADLETALEFYDRCANRNKRLKKRFNISERLIAQDELDDLLVVFNVQTQKP